MATTNIIMKIDKNLNEQLQKLLDNLGLDENTFFIMAAKQAVRKQELPFSTSLKNNYFGPEDYAIALKNATYVNGQVVIGKDDEWRDETEWDDIAKEIAEERGIELGNR